MSNIVIISAVYPPEPVVSARMGHDLACYLTDLKQSVTVVCPQPSRPVNANYTQYTMAGSTVVTLEKGAEIVRLPSFAAPRSGLIQRLIESWSFGRHVCRYLEESENQPDVMYINAWPLLAQALIIRYAHCHNIPVVLQIMDIYPESLLIKLPAVIRSVVSKPLTMLDAWIARTAHSVVVISERMRSTYTESRQISVGSVVTIPTWQDETLFENILPRSECCSRYGILQHYFTFLFLGNIGPVAGVDFLINAFAEAGIPDAQLLIVGDGTAKLECVALVKRLNLNGVHFISDSDAANVPVLQGMAHVCMLPMKRGAGMSSIPSKLPSYLFSAKPVIATVDLGSDTARFVREADCGWVGEAENSSWLANKMKEVVHLSMEELETIGKRGKKFGLAHFSKSSGVVRLADTIIQAGGGNI